MQKFREISILVLSPIPQHGKISIADCKNIRIFPDIWHMSVGSHRREESYIKINPKTNEGILRNFDWYKTMLQVACCTKLQRVKHYGPERSSGRL